MGLADLRANRHSDRLFDLECKIFLAKDVYGDEKEVTCTEASAQCSRGCIVSLARTGLFGGKDMVCGESDRVQHASYDSHLRAMRSVIVGNDERQLATLFVVSCLRSIRPIEPC